MSGTWIFRYFWFIGAAFMFVNILIWRRRLNALVGQGALSESDATHFTRVALAGLCGLSLALGIISLLAGWSDPFCSQGLSFRDAPTAASSIITIGGWVAFLGWVWIGNGADLLGRIVPALARRPIAGTHYSAERVRTVVTVLIVASAVAGYLGTRPTAARPSPGCAVPARTG
jgi:hypothetical protein